MNQSDALEQQFHQVRELDPSARTEALRALALQDAALARQVALLLDAEAAGRSDLERLQLHAGGQLSGFEPEALLGRELGGYRLVEVLGRGGMGVVFGAERELDGVRQRVAIKLLSLPLFDPAAADRFLREAAALARLEHPGICRLRDFGRSDEGWPFLVLERIDGEPLHVHASARSASERIALLAQVADAVASAHRQLVVHLDIKPDNVLVTRDGHPVLLDFGIARGLDEDSKATATMARWLTPDYAAPERLRGEPSTVAADIYSLGTVLYHVCCGTKAFELTGHSVTQALRTIEQGAAPPSRRVAGLPRDLDAVVAKAMHADPARRYASADALASDLRALLAAQPVSARPDSLGYRMGKLLQRNPIAVPLGMLATIAVVTLTVLLAFQAKDLRAQRDRAERETARARAVSELLIGSIKAADPTGDKNAAPTLNQLMEATARRLRLELATQPDLLAEGLVGIGNARAAMGQHLLAIDAYDEAIGLMERAGYSLQEQLEARIGKLDALRWSDRLDEALAQSESLLPRVSDSDRWRVLAALGSLRIRQGDPIEAEKTLTEAANAAPPDAHAQRVNIFNSLGSSLSQRGELKEARAWYDRALAEFDSAMTGSPDDEAVVRMNRAKIDASVGDGVAALADIERALEIRLGLFGENHYLTVETLGFQSIVLTELGRYDEAIAAARRAIAIIGTQPGGDQSRQWALQMQALGGAQLRAEHLEEARDTLRQALDVYALHLPSEHAEVAAVRNNLAAVYNGLGDHQGALDEMLKVWDAYHAMSPDKPTVYLAMIASNVADAYAKLGQGESGEEWSRRALQQASTTLPAEHWIVGNLHSVLASNLLLKGELDAALQEASKGESLISGAPTPVQPSIVRENVALLESIHRRLGNEAEADSYRARLADGHAGSLSEEP